MPTGQVGRDGAGSPTGAFNHRTNDVSFTVRRDGLFLMDPCCVFAVEVSTIP